MAAKLKLVLSESSVSVANNTSKVTAKLYYYGNGASYNYNNPSGTIIIDGTSYSFNHDFTTSTSAQLLATKSKTVTHNTDGSKTVSVSAKFKTGVALGTLSTSASKTLTKIARASTLALNKTSVPANGSTTVTATATKQSSSFTDTLTVTMGSYSKTITSGTAFTIPKTWVNGISGTSATATVKVTTMSGSTTIGSNTESLTITVPETSEFYPTINDVSISEAVASVTSAFGNLYVRNLSQLNVSVDASGVYGSTIKSYSTSVNGVNYIQQAFTSNVLNVAGDITLTTTVTDSRGRTATATRTINVVDYAMPSITSMTYYPCDADGNRDGNGTNTKVIISYKVYPVEEQNTKSMKLSYKAMADEAYTERALTLTDWEGTVETIISNTDSTVTYEYIAELTDSINTSNPTTYRMTTGVVTLSRLAGGKGVTLFGEAEEEGFVIKGDNPMKFTSDVALAGTRQNLNYFGLNPIASTDDDTPANWETLGTGHAYFNAMRLKNQPVQYGFVESIVHGSVVSQVFTSFTTGTVGRKWSRIGNSAWNVDWTQILTENTGIQKKLLWENASPTSSFAAQTISLDLSEYDEIEIHFKFNTSSETMTIAKATIGAGFLADYSVPSSSKIYATSRGGSCTETGVTFDSANAMTPSAATTANGNVIPVSIYGIKGVQ